MSGQLRFPWLTSSLPTHSSSLRISQVQDKQVSPFPSCSRQCRSFDVNTLPLLWTGDLQALNVVPWCGCLFLQVRVWISPAHLFCGLCFVTPQIIRSGPQISNVSWMRKSLGSAPLVHWRGYRFVRLWTASPGGHAANANLASESTLLLMSALTSSGVRLTSKPLDRRASLDSRSVPMMTTPRCWKVVKEMSWLTNQRYVVACLSSIMCSRVEIKFIMTFDIQKNSFFLSLGHTHAFHSKLSVLTVCVFDWDLTCVSLVMPSTCLGSNLSCKICLMIWLIKALAFKTHVLIRHVPVYMVSHTHSAPFFFLMSQSPLLEAGCHLSDGPDWLRYGAALAFPQVQELGALDEFVIAADFDSATEYVSPSVCCYVHNFAFQIAVHVIIRVPGLGGNDRVVLYGFFWFGCIWFIGVCGWGGAFGWYFMTLIWDGRHWEGWLRVFDRTVLDHPWPGGIRGKCPGSDLLKNQLEFPQRLGQIVPWVAFYRALACGMMPKDRTRIRV